MVVVVWEEYERAKEPVETEGNELAGDYFLADRFSDEADRQRVQELARSHARTVVEEWPLMDSGETSERADEVLRDLRLSLQGVDASTSAGQVLYDQGLTRIHQVSDARRLRLLEVDEGLPGKLWVVLLGGVVTVGFTYLFGLKNNWAHALMVAALTLVVCGILFTIGALEYPFAGQAEIASYAFEEVLRSFEEDRTP